ncbi:MAG: hypothetical protein M1827_000673 [Pycnora praestabilis]|nr:MAG: hypothetical protein M1827_000673 [Pycnora praestabilis]
MVLWTRKPSRAGSQVVDVSDPDRASSSNSTHPSIGKNGTSDEKDVGISSGRHDSRRRSSGRRMSEVEANQTLQALEKQHKWDPNLPSDLHEEMLDAAENFDEKNQVGLVETFVDDSPYPEVRAAVRNYDEPDLPANTLRAWCIGMLLATIGSAVNMLFSMRAPAIVISSLVAQLISYPIGCAWAMVMPNHIFNTFGFEWSFNRGPFNMKEHTLITIMANATFGGGVAYSTDTLLALNAFYDRPLGWGFDILLTLSTQCIGYGLAGLLRKFLVWPGAMIWPADLVNTSLFYALHDHRKSDPSKTAGWSIGRYKYFLCVFVGAFVWYWFPGYIAQFLSVFAFVTWIRPNNVVVNQLFGGWSGLSLLPITFDWTQITGYVYSPLIPPFHAIANTMIGCVFFFWFVTIGIHYNGQWYSEYLPISNSNSYDNTGAPYNVSKILSSDFTLDEAAYAKYSPLFLSTTFALTYGLSFATITALIVHTSLFHGADIWSRLRNEYEDDDVHARMMREYKDAPNWWYGILFVIFLAIALVTVLVYPTNLAWWAFFVALFISFIFAIPIGMVWGLTNIRLGLNVITEFIVGYIQPGRPIAMMLFKTYGYITMQQALSFVQDLKMGQYMKVPPRVMFSAQVTATIWSCFVQVAVLHWGLGSIKDICTSDQSNHFTCPNGRVFFQASVIWGLIGPQRIFSPGSIYSKLLWFFLLGASLPVIIYAGARMFPKSNIRYLSAPIIFGGTGDLPPATPLNYLSWGIVGTIFNKFIRNRHRGWWSQYNYITSAGLDVGLAISTIVIFFALSLTQTKGPEWWGNTVIKGTMDNLDTAVQKTVAKGEIFGPKIW